jgi:hypothetical protein
VSVDIYACLPLYVTNMLFGKWEVGLVAPTLPTWRARAQACDPSHPRESAGGVVTKARGNEEGLGGSVFKSFAMNLIRNHTFMMIKMNSRMLIWAASGLAGSAGPSSSASLKPCVRAK